MILAAILSGHTLDHLLSRYGVGAVALLVGMESLGVPLPGETMLITAALYAGTTHHLSVWAIWPAAAAGAIVGDNIGYAIGRFGGIRVLLRYGSKVRLDEAKLKVGRLVFARHGGKVVFFGRFVSVLRTYAAFLAGANDMRYPSFLAYNAAGGVIWSGIFALGFYYLASFMRRVRGPLDIALGVVAAIAVVAFLLWLHRNEKRMEVEAEKEYPGPLADHIGKKAGNR